MTSLEKKFILRHTIDLSSVSFEPKSTKTETHYTIPWCMVYFKSDNRFTFGVQCLHRKSDKWEIDTRLIFKLKSFNGTSLQLKNERTFGNTEANSSSWWEWNNLVEWEDIVECYAENEKFMIEAHLNIKKMSGGGPEKLRYFEESSQNHWDVILSVDGHKFYLSKAFLAFQSTYFDKLLFGSFKESGQAEVELKEVDHEDFQSFLELIHGESALNDNNIDGVLHLADMFNVPTAVRRCEEFLIEKSKWSLDEKMGIGKQYSLRNLLVSQLKIWEEEMKEEEFEEYDAQPIRKPSKASWFSCIRGQRN